MSNAVPAGFLGNLVLLATIVSSSNLRRRLFSLGLLSLSIVCLAEVALNMFFSLIYVAKVQTQHEADKGVDSCDGLQGTWPGTGWAGAVCRCNAALGVLVETELVLGLVFLAVERAFALLAKSYYQRHIRRARGLLCLALLWLVGVALSVPLLIPEAVPTRVFPARYFCAVQELSPVSYTAATLVIHGLAVVVMLTAFGLILRKAHQVGSWRSQILPQTCHCKAGSRNGKRNARTT